MLCCDKGGGGSEKHDFCVIFKNSVSSIIEMKIPIREDHYDFNM